VVTPQVKQAFGHLRRFAVIHSRLPQWVSAEQRTEQLAAAKQELLSYAMLAETVRACRLLAPALCLRARCSAQPADCSQLADSD